MPLDQIHGDNVSNDAIADWTRQYSVQKRRCDEENGVLRNIVKRAKSNGINTKAMIGAVAAGKLDPEDVQRELRDQIRYMAVRRIPIERDALFAGWDDQVTQKTAVEDETWEAEDAGYQAGRHGALIDDSPYPPGSELHVRWREFWHKGQAAVARELGPDAKPASTSRARPRRDDASPSASDTTTKTRRRGAKRAPAAGRRAPRADNEDAAAAL